MIKGKTVKVKAVKALRNELHGAIGCITKVLGFQFGCCLFEVAIKGQVYILSSKEIEGIKKGEQMKEWIDRATYKELLTKWRFAQAGDPFFVGELGNYYAEKMKQKREEVGSEEHVKVSKEIDGL